jgi:hypothetical protein
MAWALLTEAVLSFKFFSHIDFIVKKFLFQLQKNPRKDIHSLAMAMKVCVYDPYFVQKRNVASILELSSIQKCPDALCILAYGNFGNVVDGYHSLN